MINVGRMTRGSRTGPVAGWRVANFAHVLSASFSVASDRSKATLNRLFHT